MTAFAAEKETMTTAADDAPPPFPEGAARSLNDLARHVHATATSKGWYDPPKSAVELICLMHTELSEAVEALRHHNPPSEKIHPHSQLAEEMADEIIRVLDACAHWDINIGDAVMRKAAYNAGREHRHGGKAY